MNGPTLTRRHHPESIVYVRFTLGGVRSVGLDRRVMTGIHHYGILRSSLPSKSPVRSSSSLLPRPLQPRTRHRLQSRAFTGESCPWSHTGRGLLRPAPVP